MIVWSGRGLIPVLVFIAILFACVPIFSEEHIDYALVTACFLTGIFSWFFGNKWNNSEERIVLDEKTGQRYIHKPNHS
jgi:hypothetical protein